MESPIYYADPEETIYIVRLNERFDILEWMFYKTCRQKRERNVGIAIMEKLQRENPTHLYKMIYLMTDEWDRKEKRFLTREEQKIKTQQRLHKLAADTSLDVGLNVDPFDILLRVNKSSGKSRQPKQRKQKPKIIKRESVLREYIKSHPLSTIEEIEKGLESEGVSLFAYSNNTKSAIHVMKRNLRKIGYDVFIENDRYYISEVSQSSQNSEGVHRSFSISNNVSEIRETSLI